MRSWLGLGLGVLLWLGACGDDGGDAPSEPPDAGGMDAGELDAGRRDAGDGDTRDAASPDSGPAEPRVRWRPAFDTAQAGALFGVWGSGPDDVFIVGGTDEAGEIYHFDGDGWAPMEVSAPGALIWVTGFAPDDVYTVGLYGTVLHYDGERWEALETGVEDNLWGVFGFEADALWIVGGDTTQAEPDPVILHYDGEAFERVTVDPEENPRMARALFKVWGIDDTLFAVGHRGQILAYRDGTWQNSPGGPMADQDFVSLWGTSADNIVAVGGRANARIATYDGESWSTRGVSGMAGIVGVHMLEPDEAIIVGDRGFVGRYDVPNDLIIPETQTETAIGFHAVWGDGQGRHYAVAGEFTPPYRGAALVRTLE